jgi:integrase/recombinase XerD
VPLTPPVTPDIYNWERIYTSTKERLKKDPNILEPNRAKILVFLQTREVIGLSTPRIVKYANHLIVAARLCPKSFETMRKEDVTELLINLKNREKKSRAWTQRRGPRYAENTLSDVKTILKIFWRWLKNMDESKPIYPPEVSWFTKGKSRGITVTRSDLLTEEEVDWLAEATGDAQDAAFIKVLNDAGGRISEILTLRIKDAQPRPYGFKLDVWVSKTYSHPIPIAKSAPALARWLSLHPFRENPEAPLWLNSRRRQMLYGAARKRIQRAIQSAEVKSGRNFGKRVWFHLFRHTSATEFMRKGKGAPAVMNKKYGWSNGSDMWSVYAHMVDEDVEEAVARADAQEDQVNGLLSAEVTRRPKKCGRCESINDPSSKFCSRCAFPLDDQVVLEAYDAEEKKSEAEALLSRLMKDERVRNVISEVLSEISLKQVSQEITSSLKRRPTRQRP